MGYNQTDLRDALSIAIQYGNLGLWSYDLDTKQIRQEFSPYSAYGYEANTTFDNIPESFIEQGVIHAEDAPAYRACYQTILQGEKSSTCTVRIFDQTRSTYRWMHIYLIRQEDSPEKSRQAIGFSIDVDEEVSAQKQLRQSQAIIEAACSFANVWTFTFDIANKIAYPNKHLQEDFGFPQAVHNFPEAMFTYGLILPEYKDLYCSSFDKLRQGEPVVNFDIQTKYLDGSVHWIRFRGQLLPSDTDENLVAAVSAQVVDAEKALEARVSLERKRLQGEDSSILFYYIANVTTYTILEHAALRVPHSTSTDKLTMERLISLVPDSIRDQADRDEYLRTHEQATLFSMYQHGETHFELEHQMLSPNGRVLWVRSVMRLLKEPNTNDVLLYEYVYNVNTEKTIEELLTVILGEGYESCGSLDIRNNQYTTLSIDQKSGKPTSTINQFADVAQKHVQEKVHPDDRALVTQRHQQAAVLDGAQNRKDLVYRTIENGEVHYKKDSTYPCDQEKGIYLLTRSDITSLVLEDEREKKRLAQALKKAEEASRAKADFLASMSHDMRTPMNTILGLVALMRDEVDDPAAIEDSLDKIQSASDFMLSLVNDILDRAQIEDGSLVLKKEPYAYQDFLASMKNMFDPLCVRKGIRFEFEEVTTSLIVLTDQGRLNQIFFNILSNAVKYTPRGGCVSYHTENLEVGETSVSCDYVISDTGVGMSEEFQARMFEPFSQEDRRVTSELRGSGLGLGIAKSLVEAMGGTIAVKSQQGVGTTITIHLGFELAPPGSIKEPESYTPACPATLSGKRVLLAEDHPLNSVIAQRLLEKRGMIVTTAENGKVAVDAFKASPLNGFDVILMDIRMPEMSGLEAARVIRALDREDAARIPIIAMSANAYQEDIRKSIDAGMNKHLPKPVDPAVLHQTLEEFLRPTS